MTDNGNAINNSGLGAPTLSSTLPPETVLSRDEARSVLGQLDGTYRLIGLLLYGSGLRLLEQVGQAPA